MWRHLEFIDEARRVGVLGAVEAAELADVRNIPARQSAGQLADEGIERGTALCAQSRFAQGQARRLSPFVAARLRASPR
jgi:hypothetical protein